MKLSSSMSAVVTGGASGLGLACVRQLVAKGVPVIIADLSDELGAALVAQLQTQPGAQVKYVHADVCNTEQMSQVFDAAEQYAPLRAIIHCAGVGTAMRLLGKDNSPCPLEKYESTIRINLIGTFNTLRLAAARMAKNESVDGERGAFVLTASVAAYEGQIGQIAYSASKAGVIGMTIVSARDLAQHQIRVCTIAPGLFDTPMMAGLPENVRIALGASVPHPARLGQADEYAMTALHILENPMLNGETIRLDGALRMAPR